MNRPAAVIGCGILSILMVAAAPVGASRNMSADEFVTRIATVATGHAYAHASDAARALGSSLSFKAGTPLTDGVVALIAADLGLSVAPPSRPGSEVPAGRGEALARSIGAVLAGRSGVPPADVELPTECLSADNRGECVNCCKTATGLASNICSHFCQQITPPVSPGEPQP